MINGYTSSFAGITTNNQYNNRLQPSVFSASTSSATIFSQSYSYGTGTRQQQNNGNVSQIVNNLNNSRTQNFTYDPLNRILTAASQATSGSYCWGQNFGIDAWGNLNQITASQCTAPTLTQASNTNNQFVGFCYDAAGNLLDEIACPPSNHTFVYDAEGRLLYTAGYSYLYDGDGQRVAKCTSTGQSSTCPTSSTGTIYFRNLGGESAVEEDLSGNFQNEYIFFNGDRVVRSDSSFALHYYFHNHLMTTEVVTNPSGSLPPQQDVDYTPYGTIVYGTPSEKYLFTGKERDGESGLDNFGKRYNASNIGRWMSPDAVNVTDERLLNPANTLNKYIYGGNNPLKYIDPDGNDITIFYESGFPTGHVMLAAYNQQTGDFAFMSVGPQQHLDPGAVLHPLSGVPGTSEYSLPTGVDDLRKNFTAVTIQTNPEVAQQAIDAIRNGAGTGNWAALGNNCATSCVKLLQDIGLSPGSNMGLPWTPERFWENIQAKYGQSSNPFSRFLAGTIGAGSFRTPQNGVDTGHPRYGMNTFNWLMLMLTTPLKACVTTYGPKGPDTTCN